MTDSPHVRDVDGMRVAFGRVPQWDPQNARFLAAPRPQAPPSRARVMHRPFLPVLDQLDVGACEAFQGVDALGCAPLHVRGEIRAREAQDLAFGWYDVLTHQDEFDGAWSYGGDPHAHPIGSGEDTGTSTLALCKFLKATGRISRYEWITGDDPELLLHHLDHGGADGNGTVVLTGWGWTRSMTQPDPDGLITVKGPDIGGHATILRGYHRVNGIWRLRGRNHWSHGWGLAGEYDIAIDGAGNRMREGGDQAVLYR